MDLEEVLEGKLTKVWRASEDRASLEFLTLRIVHADPQQLIDHV